MAALSSSAPVVPLQFGGVMKPDESALPNLLQAMDKVVKPAVSDSCPVVIMSSTQSEENLEIT